MSVLLLAFLFDEHSVDHHADLTNIFIYLLKTFDCMNMKIPAALLISFMGLFTSMVLAYNGKVFILLTIKL